MKLLLTLSILSALVQPVSVKSPSGALEVTLSNPSGRAMYTVTYNGQTVLGESSLGLVTSIGDLTKDLTLTQVEESRVEKHYDMRTTKASRSDYLSNELTAAFEGKEDRILKVTFRVSDSGYCGAHLGEYQSGKGYSIAYPAQTENGGYGTVSAACALPLTTPWRTITIGPLGTLVDDKKGCPTLSTLRIKADGTVKVTLQPGGGLIIKD